MSNLHIDRPIDAGISSAALKEQGADHAAQELTNFWFDSAMDQWTSRPPFAQVVLAGNTVGVDGGSPGPYFASDLVAWGCQATLVSDVEAYTGGVSGMLLMNKVTGRVIYKATPPVTPITQISATALSGYSSNNRYIGWTRSFNIGGKVYGVMRNGQGLADLTNNTITTLIGNPGGALAADMGQTRDACWAFGRWWVVGTSSDGQSGVLLWSNAGGASFATASSGGGMVFNSSTTGVSSPPRKDVPRAIIALHDQLVIVWGNCIQYWGANDGNKTPVNPGGANGLVLLKQIDGVGCEVTGFVQNVGESAVMLTSQGLVALSRDSQDGRFYVEPLAPQASGALIRFYRQVLATKPAVGDGQTPGYNAHALYDPLSGNLFLWATHTSRVAVCNFSAGGVRVSFWAAGGLLPHYTAIVDIGGVSQDSQSRARKIVGYHPSQPGLLQVLDLNTSVGAVGAMFPPQTWEPAYSALAMPTFRRMGLEGFTKILKRAILAVRYARRNRVTQLTYAITGAQARGWKGDELNVNLATTPGTQALVDPGITDPTTVLTGARFSIPLRGSAEEASVGLYIPDARDIQCTFDALEVQYVKGGRASGTPN